MKTYEIHTFTKGKWSFNSVYEDDETARYEAGRMKQGGHHEAICVTEEIFDEESNSSSSRTIYSTGDTSTRKKTSRALTSEGLYRARPPPRGQKAPYRNGSAGFGVKSLGFILPIFILVALLVAGAGALYGLQMIR